MHRRIEVRDYAQRFVFVCINTLFCTKIRIDASAREYVVAHRCTYLYGKWIQVCRRVENGADAKRGSFKLTEVACMG